MKNKTMILNECVQFINKFEILEYHIFIEYITKNSIYFYELISRIKNDKIILKKIIVMLNINYDFFIQSMNIIESTFKKNNHKNDYSHEYYLIMISQFVNNVNQ